MSAVSNPIPRDHLVRRWPQGDYYVGYSKRGHEFVRSRSLAYRMNKEHAEIIAQAIRGNTEVIFDDEN